MTGFREHPLDKPLKAMVEAMHNADQQLGLMSKDMGEFDSKELTPQEDELIFNFPSLRYSGQVHPQTGLPFTNAQAAQQLLQDIGPEQYVSYVNDFVRRMDRRAKENPGNASVAIQSGGPGESPAVRSSEPAGLATSASAQDVSGPDAASFAESNR